MFLEYMRTNILKHDSFYYEHLIYDQDSNVFNFCIFVTFLWKPSSSLDNKMKYQFVLPWGGVTPISTPGWGYQVHNPIIS